MTPEQKISLVMRKLSILAAEFWAENIRPNPINEVFNINGVRVRIQISEPERDTQPLGGAASWDEQRAEQGSGL